MADRVELFGLKIDNLSFDQALQRIDAYIRGDGAHYVVTPNVDHVVRYQNDPRFQQIYAEASLVVTDGTPLLWASRLLKRGLAERVTGADLLPALCSLAVTHGYSIYLLGSTPEVLEAARDNLLVRHAGLKIAGIHHGYFSEDNTDGVVAAINELSPDILFIGMGSPKQELWIMRNRSKLNIKVALCIGGVFEILAGTRRRAPRWMQRVGLEWLYRLLQDPRRLWKRYLIDDMVFFRLLAREMLLKKKTQ